MSVVAAAAVFVVEFCRASLGYFLCVFLVVFMGYVFFIYVPAV